MINLFKSNKGASSFLSHLQPGSGYKKGFTLTEILVVVVIFILLLEVVYSVYVLSQKGYQGGEDSAEIVQNARVILERMSREIRQAREVVSELSDDEAGATSTIEFEDGHATTTYCYIRYYQNDGAVKRCVRRYYFPSAPDIFLPWNATSPTETLTATTTQGPLIIGEHINPAGLKFWGSYVINVSVLLSKGEQEVDISTKIFGRNL